MSSYLLATTREARAAEAAKLLPRFETMNGQQLFNEWRSFERFTYLTAPDTAVVKADSVALLLSDEFLNDYIKSGGRGRYDSLNNFIDTKQPKVRAAINEYLSQLQQQGAMRSAESSSGGWSFAGWNVFQIAGAALVSIAAVEAVAYVAAPSAGAGAGSGTAAAGTTTTGTTTAGTAAGTTAGTTEGATLGAYSAPSVTSSALPAAETGFTTTEAVGYIKTASGVISAANTVKNLVSPKTQAPAQPGQMIDPAAQKAAADAQAARISKQAADAQAQQATAGGAGSGLMFFLPVLGALFLKVAL